ncbi:MAG TPA: glycosyltransferase family 39 protein [Burkholderiaceae bacterium]|nr:glycosyltransferase family 39 protein [Burkholderiaceae bacterium]
MNREVLVAPVCEKPPAIWSLADAPGSVVGLLAFAWLAALAWVRPLMLPDEGRYVGVAWEMLRSGNWLVPTLDGLPFFHKPPLFYWITGVSLKLLGMHWWAARLASLAGATGALTGLFVFTRNWCGSRMAALCAVVLATMPFFYSAAQFANLDMLVAGCITLTVLLGANAVLMASSGRPHSASLIAAYGVAAIGVLVKGLIGVMLPALTLIAWLLATRRPALLLRLVSVPGLLLFVLIGAPWFVLMQERFSGFLHYFFVYQHFERFAKGGFNNQQPFWFYLVVLPLCALPWSLNLWRVSRGSDGGGHERGPQPGLDALMWSWLTIVVVFFSLPASKLAGYVLPALPPLAWLLARSLSAGKNAMSRHMGRVTTFAAVLCLSIVVAVALYGHQDEKAVAQALRTERRPGEPVLAFNHYPYALPFDARLHDGLIVVDNWGDLGLSQRDDWRKELYDAAAFDPARARKTLLTPGAAFAFVCEHERSWIVVRPGIRPPWAGGKLIATSHRGELWQLERHSLNCPGTPNVGSPDR